MLNSISFLSSKLTRKEQNGSDSFTTKNIKHLNSIQRLLNITKSRKTIENQY